MPDLHSTGDSAITQVRSFTRLQEHQWVGDFEGTLIRSAFQPIYSLLHSRLVGVEGLMRCTSAQDLPISPLDMLDPLRRSTEDAILLDRLCRYLHIRNMVQHLPHAHWIFLNVSARTVIDGSKFGHFFGELIQEAGLPAHRIVIEILEDNIGDEEGLARAVEYYRRLGCIIAIDDFGAGHSNINRVWEISPEIVKLDRSLVVRAANHRLSKRTLPNLVNLLHESGSLVLIEGIETEAEAIIAMKAGVDMVQGYYFARPAACTQTVAPVTDLINQVRSKYIENTRMDAAEFGRAYRAHIETFMSAISQLRECTGITAALADLIEMPLVIRCYALTENGKQLTGSLSSTQRSHQNHRFAVLTDGEGADWSTRSYFRKACQNPGHLQISEPYLSVADARMCITLSIYVTKTPQVICCDIEWQE